jgi:hypothetical protein
MPLTAPGEPLVAAASVSPIDSESSALQLANAHTITAAAMPT